MGGIGKTALALKLAEALGDHYPDAQLFLNLRGTAAGGPEAPPGERPMTAREAMGDVIHAFRPEEKLPEDLEHLQPFYLTVLKGRKALLLMDNAADADQVRPLIPPAGCVMLVTSRNHFVLPGWKALDLRVLPRDDARRLLMSIAERIDGQADRIAELCGCLPLALRAVASALAASPNLDPAEYARCLADERTRLEAIGKEGVDISLEASFNLSYKLLPAETARVCAALAVFPGTFEAQAAEAVCNDSGHKHLSELVRRSLVEYIEPTQRYRLHDLVRLFAGKQLGDSELREGQFHHARYFNSILALAHQTYLKGGEGVLEGLGVFDTERHNIEAGQAWAAANAAHDSQAADLCNRYPDSGADCIVLRLHPRERICWLEEALSVARRLGLRLAEGCHLGNLGAAHAQLGESRRAIELLEQALRIHREVGDRRAEGQDLANLGIAHRSLGGPRRAIEFYEKALGIHREIGDRRGESDVLGNLGSAYGSLGEPRRAIECHEQALAIDREIGDRRGEGQDLGNLGLAYGNLGEPHRAIEFFEQALAVLREIGDRPGEGSALGNLGNAYGKLGDSRRAIEFHEQALAIDREIGDRRGEGQDLGNLGNAYVILGEFRRAIEFYEQRLVIAREIGDKEGEAAGLWNMALSLRQVGEKGRAIRCAEEALGVFEAIEHPRTTDVRARLAEWREQGP